MTCVPLVCVSNVSANFDYLKPMATVWVECDIKS